MTICDFNLGLGMGDGSLAGVVRGFSVMRVAEEEVGIWMIAARYDVNRYWDGDDKKLMRRGKRGEVMGMSVVRSEEKGSGLRDSSLAAGVAHKAIK